MSKDLTIRELDALARLLPTKGNAELDPALERAAELGEYDQRVRDKLDELEKNSG